MIDRDRILALFRHSGGRLITSGEMVAGQFYGKKPIIEYTGRITDARNELGCTCGQDQSTCKAQEHIRNVKQNYYQYVSSLPKKPKLEPTEEKLAPSNLASAVLQRNQLRKEYKMMIETGRQDTIDARLILARGKTLSRAIGEMEAML